MFLGSSWSLTSKLVQRVINSIISPPQVPMNQELKKKAAGIVLEHTRKDNQRKIKKLTKKIARNKILWGMGNMEQFEKNIAGWNNW
uniref:Uncharacterized protein n=1 Tax=Arion vulgaris TaxID=1028688 RepID=A0A0B6ZGJ5_9EUPU